MGLEHTVRVFVAQWIVNKLGYGSTSVDLGCCAVSFHLRWWGGNDKRAWRAIRLMHRVFEGAGSKEQPRRT